MKIERKLKKTLEQFLFKGKIIIVYGPRQVGKTTLCKELIAKYGSERSYVDCEIIEKKQALEDQNPDRLRKFLGDGKFFVLDEAQKVSDIGTSLKLLVDTYPDIQIVATGSSSFDLANKINEPLTGRAYEFMLYPISWGEIRASFPAHEVAEKLPTMLRFGSYPKLLDLNYTEPESKLYLSSIASNYLYKDIFALETIKKPELLLKLLQLLALQLGGEVSFYEIATKLVTSVNTVLRYIDLLEKAFVIFRLYPLSRNLRNEIGKKTKIFFYDLGIRNALIGNTNALHLRNDIGGLWENFCIIERKKKIQYDLVFLNQYFWRNRDGAEVDYVEERDGTIKGFEFKWAEGAYRKPKTFLESYHAGIDVINRNNFEDFLL